MWSAKSALTLGIALFVLMDTCAVRALPPFKEAFDVQYVKGANNAKFQAAFAAAGCNTCHVKGKPKKMHNAYGEALDSLIPGNAKQRLDAAEAKGGQAAKNAEMTVILKDLQAAFSKAEAMKAPGGQTFGARIKAGQLP